MRITSRRRFLQTGFQASVSIPLMPLAAKAIEPLSRNGTPKFKFSLAAYSYRDLLKSGQLSLPDFIHDCAEMQLDGTELTSYYFPQPTGHDYLRELKQECFQLGLEISGTAIRNDFGYPEGEQRRAEIEHVKKWIEFAEILGAPVIRIFAGHARDATSDSQTHALMVAGMEECCEYAGQHGVHLALENHGGPTTTAAQLLKLVQDVKSPWFGVNLDTGNFQSEDVYDDIARVAPYALNVQVKVVVNTGGQKQPSDFPRLAKILRDVGYRGYIVLEYEEDGDPRVECPEYTKRIREAFS